MAEETALTWLCACDDWSDVSPYLSITSSRCGPGVDTALARCLLNSFVSVARIAGTPIPFASEHQSIFGLFSSKIASAFHPGFGTPTFANSPFKNCIVSIVKYYIYNAEVFRRLCPQSLKNIHSRPITHSANHFSFWTSQRSSSGHWHTEADRLTSHR